jgi:hypothetical protein
MKLRKGVLAELSRRIQTANYLFYQQKGSEFASISVLRGNGMIKLINANFDPTKDDSHIWGSPPAGMSTATWSRHCQKALREINEVCGLRSFHRLQYRRRFTDAEGNIIPRHLAVIRTR